jgi:cyanophycin synthetase
MKSLNPNSLEILEKKIFRGPSLYDHSQGILLIIDIGDLEDLPTKKIPGFTERLLFHLSGLKEHGCSYGVPGGFIRRMTEDEGTWIGHVFEHTIIEIQSLAGLKVTHGKTRQIKGAVGRTGKISIYRVYSQFVNEETAIAATELALNLINGLITGQIEFNFQEELENVILIAERFALGPSTRSIVNNATERGIPFIRLEKMSSLVQFGWGKNQKRIWASTSSNSSYISTEIAQDKELTLQLLYDVGIPVPKGGVAKTVEDLIYESERVGFPLVLKPLDVSHGRGVSLNIHTEEELLRAFEIAQEYSSSTIVEKFINGKDFRVLVINGQFVAAAERIPAHVVGDGVNTVQNLIDIINQDPRRGIGHEKVLTKIYVDDNTERLLVDQNLTLTSIPKIGQYVQLKSTANLSTGGTARDVTDIIHFDNIQLAERAVKTIGLDIAGVDIITDDITTPIKTNGGVIIEVNAAPGFRMHLEPTEGTPRNVAKHVIDMLFPNNSDGRIPVIAVTGTNGKTSVTRWIAHILKLAGNKVGFTTTDGIYIDGILEYSGDCTGPWSAKVVLRDPTVNFAVLETARGGIVKEGLGWDKSDVSVFLNVSNDHLGLHGINTLEEMAELKGVILDQVKSEGIGVLNADDPLVMAQKHRIDGSVTLVSLDYQNPVLIEHINKGGTAVTITPNGIIQLIQRQSQTAIIQVKDIPATFNGYAIFAIQNAMFVVASTIPFVSIENIRAGLSTFSTSFATTPGRMNVERIKGARVIIDYGHNPSALLSQLQLVNGFYKDQRNIGRKAIVFGLPGDRDNETIIEAITNISGKYDKYFVKEDWSLRGRESGELPLIIKEILVNNGVLEDKISLYYGEKNELNAVADMYEWLELNDIVLLQADDINKVRKHLLQDLGALVNESIDFKSEREHIPMERKPMDFSKILKNLPNRVDETSD